MRVVFDHFEDLAKEIKTLWFRPKYPVRYTAGQFTQIHLPHTNVDEHGDKRWFTLSSSPSEPMLAITTRYVQGQSSSFKKRLFSLKPGAEISMAEPMGDFVLPKDKSIPLVFIAGGIGITPMRSIIKWLIDTDEKRDIKLLYGIQAKDKAVFLDLFKAYGASTVVTARHLSCSEIISLAGGTNGTLLFLAGPESMVEALTNGLKQLGVDSKWLIADYFHGYDSV